MTVLVPFLVRLHVMYRYDILDKLLSNISNYQKAQLPEKQLNANLDFDLLDEIWNDDRLVFIER